MQWFSLAVVGLGIGLLAGLAVSPVLSAILASLIGAAATVTALFGRYGGAARESPPRPHLTPSAAPLALLTLTILLGSLIGMSSRLDLAAGQQAARLRALDLAPPSTIREALEAWTALGIDPAVVRKGLFEAYLGVVGTEAEQAAKPTAGLYAAPSASDCVRLQNASENALRLEMRAAASRRFALYAERIEDPAILEIVVDVECEELREQDDG